LEFVLRKLAIESVKAQLAVRRFEREGLVRKAENAETSAIDKFAALRRMAKIEGEARGLEETLDLLEDET
jgi:hypothetical protein